MFDSHFFSFLISLPPQQFFTGTLSPEKERLEQTKVGNKSVLNDMFDLLGVWCQHHCESTNGILESFL